MMIPFRTTASMLCTHHRWYHRRCVHNLLAVVQAHADEEQGRHTETPEQATVLEWVQAAEQAHARVQAGLARARHSSLCASTTILPLKHIPSRPLFLPSIVTPSPISSSGG